MDFIQYVVFPHDFTKISKCKGFPRHTYLSKVNHMLCMCRVCHLIHLSPMKWSYFFVGSNLESVKKNGKTVISSGGYGPIQEIPHGLIWPD